MGYLPSSAFAAMPELFALMPRIFLQVFVLSFSKGVCSHGFFSKFTDDMKSWAQTSPPLLELLWELLIFFQYLAQLGWIYVHVWWSVVVISGLSHEKSQQKMRLLTFMQMSENRTEIDFETIMKEMNLSENDVESFIIDGELQCVVIKKNAITRLTAHVRVVWCLIWWFASIEKSTVIHDTENPYWDQVSLNSTSFKKEQFGVFKPSSICR